jgi:hypothetical protein
VASEGNLAGIERTRRKQNARYATIVQEHFRINGNADYLRDQAARAQIVLDEVAR